MKIENPKVTLADEARNGVEEEVRSGFLDWLLEFNVEGDDGEIYALAALSSPLHSKRWIWSICATQKARVE